jgi:hypothetical protein
MYVETVSHQIKAPARFCWLAYSSPKFVMHGPAQLDESQPKTVRSLDPPASAGSKQEKNGSIQSKGIDEGRQKYGVRLVSRKKKAEEEGDQREITHKFMTGMRRLYSIWRLWISSSIVGISFRSPADVPELHACI